MATADTLYQTVAICTLELGLPKLNDSTTQQLNNKSRMRGDLHVRIRGSAGGSSPAPPDTTK